MDNEQVQNQLNNMVSFILQEAKEKAEEITLRTEEECEGEKSRLIEQQRSKIKKEFERKEKQVLIAQKIAESNEINRSRIEILKEREGGLQNIFEEAKGRLNDLSNDQDRYRGVLQSLILQGLIMMQEEAVVVQCRSEDVNIVRDVSPKAKKEYESRTGKTCDVSIHTKYLPSYPDCSGGIYLTAQHGRIVLNNTLDTRLKYAYDVAIPKIRYLLFDHDEDNGHDEENETSII